ncbi:hypothetical protein AB832_07015 [Flavobacteriaceae bacterium (ex Bugula neritina AB1)]|nr:hypothetical protein AB832_07015 [Flavobacteriaceae bacterium (ex Bugula neritina AB1)]
MGLDIQQITPQLGTYTYINSGSQLVSSGVETLLENDGFAGQNFPLEGLTEIFNTSTFLVGPLDSVLSFGDIVEVGLAFNVTTTSPNQLVEIRSKVAIGSPSESTTELFNATFKNVGAQPFTTFFPGDGQTADQLNFPSAFYVFTDDTLTISMSYMFFKVTKRFL